MSVRCLSEWEVSMRIFKLTTVLLLLGMWTNAIAQEKYAHLKSWDSKYPTFNKSARKFFDIPAVKAPLKRLLNRQDYYLLTKGHTKEMPIRLVKNYLKVRVCGTPSSYACINQTILAIDLNDGSIYVAFDILSGEPRYFSSKGKFTELPQNVQSWHERKAGT